MESPALLRAAACLDGDALEGPVGRNREVLQRFEVVASGGGPGGYIDGLLCIGMKTPPAVCFHETKGGGNPPQSSDFRMT